MVLMIPLNTVNNKKGVEKKSIETQSFCEDNFLAMGKLLEASDWDLLRNCSSINETMKAFHDELFRMFDHCFPEKKKVIYSESEPFMTGALLKLRRKKNREFNKHRKSPKYIQLDLRYKEMLSKSMKQFYRKRIKSLKTSNPRQWYRSLKRIVGYDVRDDKPSVEDIKHLSDVDQAEFIAESFSKVSKEYAPLDRSRINLEEVKTDDYLDITDSEVLETLLSLNTNKSVPKMIYPRRF